MRRPPTRTERKAGEPPPAILGLSSFAQAAANVGEIIRRLARKGRYSMRLGELETRHHRQYVLATIKTGTGRS